MKMMAHNKRSKKNHLLIQFDFFDEIKEGDDLVAVVGEQPVPAIDLSRLVQEYLFLLLKVQRPLVNGLLQLAVVHCGTDRRGSRCRSPDQNTTS